jgi:hypothetical protein
MAWNEKEISDITLVIEHLNCALKVALGVSLKFDSEKGEVIVYSESLKEVRRINVVDSSALGVIQDVVQSF